MANGYPESVAEQAHIDAGEGNIDILKINWELKIH
jgi:hypothetical protein